MFKLALSARVAVGLLAGLATVGALESTARAGDAPAPAPKAATADKAATKPAAKPSPKTADAARKAFAEGQKAYGAGNYVDAQASFTKANELIPSPQASYWIAKCIDGQNKTEEAIAAYEALLADPESSKIGEEKLADSKTRLDALKATLVGEVAIETNPMLATIAVDGVAQPGEAPMTLKLTPGKHKVTISAKGYQPKDVELDVKGGDKLKQSVTLEKEAPPPIVAPVVAAPAPVEQPPPPPKEERSMVPAYVTLGIAGVGAVVGTIFGISALNAKNDFNKTPTTELADKAERDALICDMAFGVAITLGVTGVVLLTSDDEPAAAKAAAPKTARLQLTPYAGKKSGGAAAKLTF
ncbi:MAG TPA: PEGA domain-containing protein [Polyangiaceae bacterium]